MVDRQSPAGEAGGIKLNQRESADQVLRRIEAAINTLAANLNALPSADDLFSPAVQKHEAERLNQEYAALKERYAALSRDHDHLRQAHGALLARQAEAHARLGAVVERLQAMLPGIADGWAGLLNDGTEDGA